MFLAHVLSVTDENVVTFRRSHASLSLDESWTAGDLSFAFRTAQERAVLFHQVTLPVHVSNIEQNETVDHVHQAANDDVDAFVETQEQSITNASFKITVLGPNEIEFAYSLRGVFKTTRLITEKRINTGEWQHVRVDTDPGFFRFTINESFLKIDLKERDRLHFPGSLFIGGSADGSDVGLRGCFRGLSIGGKTVKLPDYVKK